MNAIRLMAAVLAAATLTFAAQAAEVAGVPFPETTEVAGEELVLNGAGLRKKLWFKVYAAGLYLPETANAADEVFRMGGPKLVRIQALRDLTRDQLVDAVDDGFQRNLSDRELADLEPRIARFRGLYTDAEEGDELVLRYLPAEGTQILNNGNLLGTIEGEDFYDAVLRIWLGDDPADAGLKTELLGRR